jgi:two-component system cell cycle sensor histidine kinase/response regulator CckA
VVSDNGIGMDKETQQKIFEPFFTTKDKIKGTGLGLSTVYGIVKQNKGYIYVYSEKDKGTSIKIYWPQKQFALAPERSDEGFKKIEGGNETILFVEDNEEGRNFTVEALQSLGYNVIEAKDGREAFEILNNNDKEIHLIVSDVVMPHMGGGELVDLLHKNDKNLQIILTSGYADHHIMHSGSLKEEINFLHKPYSIEQLATKVRTVLNN